MESTGEGVVKGVIEFFTKYPLLGEKMVQMEVAKVRMEAKRLAKISEKGVKEREESTTRVNNKSQQQESATRVNKVSCGHATMGPQK